MSDESLFSDMDVSLEPAIREVFEPMCQALPSEEAQALVPQIRDHAQAIRLVQKENEFIDAEMAEQIATALITLFREYDNFSSEHQALVVGAARYFIQSQDVEGDLTPILGCEDDALVLNYVLERLGCDGLKGSK